MTEENKAVETKSKLEKELSKDLTIEEESLLQSYNTAGRPSNKRHIFILLKPSGELIASMDADGELKLGDDTQEAAKEFWKYVKTFSPLGNTDQLEVVKLKAMCFDLMQENKALKTKIALLVSK